MTKVGFFGGDLIGLINLLIFFAFCKMMQNVLRSNKPVTGLVTKTL